MKKSTLLFSVVIMFLIIVIVVLISYIFFTRSYLNDYIYDVIQQTAVECIKDNRTTEPDNTNIITDNLSNADSNNEATISGTVSYPSEKIYPMTVCAVDATNKKEICVDPVNGENSYSINIEPGEYYVYAIIKPQETTVQDKAYYSKCDLFDDPSLHPDCNQYMRQEPVPVNWYTEGFDCFEDTLCREAHTPVTIMVDAGEQKQLNPIFQGWYKPCGDGCNDPNYDFWQEFFE